MFNKINDLFDKKNEESYLEEYLPLYKKIRNLTGFILLSMVIIICGITYTIFLSNKPKEITAYKYVENQQTFEKIELYNNPSFSTEKLQNYVEVVLLNIFDINFSNANKFDSFQKYFTEKAWEDFDKYSKEEDGYLSFILKNSLNSKPLILEKPLLMKSIEYLDGTKKWNFVAKMSINYTGSIKHKMGSKNLVNIILTTADNSQNPNGLLIERLDVLLDSN